VAESTANTLNLAGGAALGDAVTAVQQTEAALGVPATLTGSFQGTAQAFQASLSTTPYLIAAALLVVYLILGVLYESFIHPLTILSTLPSAAVGALLLLLVFSYDLGVIAIICIIMLIGIVKKNGIMMVDFALSAQRERNLPPEDAIYQACVLRFRPIMMTTMCAIRGGLPLMLAGGTGSELRQATGASQGKPALRRPLSGHRPSGPKLSLSLAPLASPRALFSFSGSRMQTYCVALASGK